MREFANFLVEKLRDIKAKVDVRDDDEFHLMIYGESSTNVENFLVENLLIPLMARFILICENCEPNPAVGVIVQELSTTNRFIIFMRQNESSESKFILTISITAVLP